jgi:hypothetical protein
MSGPNPSFGVQTISMKKLSVFRAFRFSEFRIRDCVPVVVVVVIVAVVVVAVVVRYYNTDNSSKTISRKDKKTVSANILEY